MTLALLPLADLSHLIRDGEVSPAEVTRAFLNRIEALNSELHAFNTVAAELALEAARLAEADIVGGNWRGPLHGIPIGIKDMIDVAGLPTTAQAAHRRNAIAKADAAVVANLRHAGAIILGKQAMSEYAVGGTQLDHVWPPARNPWDLTKDALSSSSGSCISVAAGLCAGSIGTETAGSIRDPAAWNGVAGLCPTAGLVSRAGVLPLSETMDSVGPIAWTVEDCALLLNGMLARSSVVLSSSGLRTWRIGVPRSWFESDPDVTPEVLRATANALDTLTSLGAQLVDIELGDFERFGVIARAISWPEEYAAHLAELDAFPDRLTAVSRSRLQDGKAYSAADYIIARKQRSAAIASFVDTMEGLDVLVLPTMKTAALPMGFEFTELGNTEISYSRPFNLLGVPGLNLCSGFTGDGLPIGVQFVGRPYEDTKVLEAGRALETALALRRRRPKIALF